MKIKLLCSLFCAFLLMITATCTTSGSNPAGSENDSPTETIENLPAIAHESEFSLPTPSLADHTEEQYSQLPSDDEAKEARNSCAGQCLENYSYLYANPISFAFIDVGPTQLDCRKVLIKDRNGKEVFRAQLKDNCRIDIKYIDNGVEKDTSFFVQ